MSASLFHETLTSPRQVKYEFSYYITASELPLYIFLLALKGLSLNMFLENNTFLSCIKRLVKFLHNEALTATLAIPGYNSRADLDIK